MNTDDFLAKAIADLHRSNELIAAQAMLKAVTDQKTIFRKHGDLLAAMLRDVKDYAPTNAITETVITKALNEWEAIRLK